MNAADLVYLGLPTTLDEAVECLNDTLGPDDKRTLMETLEDDLVDCHFGLGLAIRNAFAFHSGNPDLLAACGTTHPDDAAAVIIEALWHRLQDGPQNV
jgi:hypothetical protein